MVVLVGERKDHDFLVPASVFRGAPGQSVICDPLPTHFCHISPIPIFHWLSDDDLAQDELCSSALAYELTCVGIPLTA